VQGRARLKPVIEFLKRHLLAWDVRDDNGEITALSAENLRRLPLTYQAQALDHIMGYAGVAAPRPDTDL
jgi:hypothetical protein